VADDFSQPFVLGTNVVGVLPGSDPNLAQEVVIVSAHYDHLGRTRQGMCLGAADNAAGVAALLEIAESFVLKGIQFKRSVCFAAFDQEEKGLLGAFAFACREDFDPNRIAGVVNIDLLGRKGFGVLENHLFLSGTEDYRELRRQIQAATTADITLLPAGTDIVGPRADHVAFEGLGFPTLFYSCGLYEDYHKPGDTPDKLGYAKLSRSTHVIKDTVSLLANAQNCFERTPETQGDREELEVLALCLERLSDNLERLELSDADANSLRVLSGHVASLLEEGDYTRLDRERLIRRSAMALLPVIGRFEPEETHRLDRRVKAEDREALDLARKKLLLLEMMELRPLAAEAGRALMRQLPQSRARLLWPMAKMSHKGALVSDLYMDFQPLKDGTHQLIFVAFGGEVSFHWPGLLLLPWAKMPGVAIEARLVPVYGSQQEIADVCLLMWREKREESEDYDHVMRAVLTYVTDQTQGDDYDQCLAKRLESGGWPDESAWLKHMMQSPNASVAMPAIRQGKESLGSEWEPLVQGVLSDAATPEQIKWDAMGTLDKTGTRETLFVLINLLDDERKRNGTRHILQFKDPNHPILELMHRSSEYTKLLPKPKPKKIKIKPESIPQTLGGVALKKLKAMTRKDFGKNAQAWKNWVNTHWKNDRG
ncbi:MAG: M28 family peptidase, partial [Planctomycetes bacterium]|nr:M28 family peptidase [Planctomycetota bacterium]